jgi:hypothetical protein
VAAARGPQSGPVKIYYKGLQPMIKSLQNLEDRLDNLDMAAAVRGAGQAWQRNWARQGRDVGSGWKPVSEYTRGIREHRGFNPRYPILHQSGNLRTIAADVPAKFSGRSTSRTVGAGYSGGDQTHLQITTTQNRATLLLQGEKVQNNFGGRTVGHGWQNTELHYVPQRRFWYVNDEVRTKVAEAIGDSVKDLMDESL